MLIYALFIVLLSTSKGLPRILGHYLDKDESFENVLLDIASLSSTREEIDNEYQRKRVDDTLLNAIKVLQHKRNVPYESEDEEYGYNSSDLFSDLITKAYRKSILHRRHNNKRQLYQKSRHTSREKEKSFDEKEDRINHESKNLVQKKKSIDFKLKNNDAVAMVQTDEVKETEKKSSKKNNNVQVATVTMDDTIQKQEEYVRKLDPKNVFYEPDMPESSNLTTTSKTPQTSHRKQPGITTTKESREALDRVSFIAVVTGCVVAAVAGIALATYCWFKLRREAKNLNDEPLKPASLESQQSKNKKLSNSSLKNADEDTKLVQSAEVFHYLHAKKQMQQMVEPKKAREDFVSDEGVDDDEEGDENTVYECPGLAPPGDMKVSNPLFSDAESYHSDHHSDKQSDTPSHESVEDLKKSSPPSSVK